MDLEISSDPRELEREWWDLWHRDPAATPFQSPAWLLPWRRQFAEGETLIVTLRRDGKLMALLPLYRYQERLLLWGAGTSDWLDGIFAPELEPEDLDQALLQLGEPLDLFQLRADSPLRRMPPPADWTESTGASACCVALALPLHLPRHMAQNLRYYGRRAASAGVQRPERADAAAFDDLVALHTRRWSRGGQSGVLADPLVLAWHREALPMLQAAGLLRFYVLRQHERIISAIYVLASKRRTFYYIGGFDPDLSELGLGTLLVAHAIAEAEREGAHTFDFLRGQEPYKYRWGATDQPTFARFLSPNRERQWQIAS
jgi:CelD/BcsL family acetyltransferase involved in cellulose biosynthesis